MDTLTVEMAGSNCEVDNNVIDPEIISEQSKIPEKGANTKTTNSPNRKFVTKSKGKKKKQKKATKGTNATKDSEDRNEGQTSLKGIIE